MTDRAAPGRPRVLVVIGTRPEGIKLAPVVHALGARPELETRLALTGQHTALLDQVLTVFGLEPAWDLGIMREGQDLYDVAHGCLDGLRHVCEAYRPDILLVQGDTASVFFGALVAFFERTRVGHVEAGLRSGDKWRPYPEELLRRMTSVVTDLHFAPTPGARANLLAEGIPPAAIHVTGNTVVDALEVIRARAGDPRNPALAEALARGRRLVLLTAHRRESFGAPLRAVFRAVRALADEFDDIDIVYPVHPNPQVRIPAQEELAGHERIHLLPPLEYFDLVHCLGRAVLVLTDSGGIQEEAPTFGVPVLVLREVTERPEGVAAGIAQLVGMDPDVIRTAARVHLRGQRQETELPPNPYGDGRAGERIADVLAHVLAAAPRQTRDWNGRATPRVPSRSGD